MKKSIFLLAFLLSMLWHVSAVAEECGLQTDFCFGINWKTATLADMQGINVRAKEQNGNTPLHWAAAENENPNIIAALIQAGADIHAKNKDGYTPLHWAALWNKNPDIIAALIQEGADIRAKDKHNKGTPLHYAVGKGNPNIIAALIQEGADINVKNKAGGTPLHWAAKWRNPNIIATLIVLGADTQATNNKGQTAEDVARSEGRLAKYQDGVKKAAVEIFKNLAPIANARRINVRAKDPYGNTPLHQAARNQNPDIINALIQAGADIRAKNKYGYTPLHWAAWWNENPDTINALIQAGADINAKDEDGITPLHRAAQNENADIISALIQAEADINAKDKDGDTPLHLAAGFNENPDIINALIQADADILAQDKYGNTPLHRAANWNKNIDIINALIQAGSDIHAKTNIEHTPLHLAPLGNENPDIIPVLIQAGADIHAKDKAGDTPLHNAAGWGKNPDIIAALIQAGADTKATNNDGESAEDLARSKGHLAIYQDSVKKAAVEIFKNLATLADMQGIDPVGDTPLHQAARNENPDIFTALIQEGADIHAKNKYGYTPLHWAAWWNKNPDIIAALIQAGADIRAQDKYGYTPLHQAAGFNENPDIINALIQEGADIHAKNKYGYTPLHQAAGFNKNPNIINALRQAGADINAKEQLFGNTPLHQAVWWNESPDIIAALIQAGADTKATNNDGESAEDLARSKGRLAIYQDGSKKVAVAISKSLGGVNWKTATLADVQGINVRAKNQDGRTPLHQAAAYNENPDIIAALIQAGADILAKNKDGETPLHQAAKRNKNPAIINALIQEGADILAKNKNGETPLHQAAWWNENPDIINALIQKDAEINAKDEDGYTPLHRAAWWNKNPDIITALIVLGADTQATNNDGESAEDLARNKGRLAIYQDSAKKASRVIAGIEKKAEENLKKVAETLKNLGGVNWQTAVVADVAKADLSALHSETGETVLHIAARHGTPEVVAALIKKGIRVGSRDKDGANALHAASESGNVGVLAVLNEKININAQDKDGNTSLHDAVLANQQQAVLWLLENEANATIANKNGKTPLALADENADFKNSEAYWTLNDANYAPIKAVKAVETLKNLGGVNWQTAVVADVAKANLSARHPETGETVLHYAARYGTPKVVAALIKKGARVNSRDKDGANALHAAVKSGNVGALDVLIKKININAQDKDGNTSLHYAVLANQQQAVLWLLENEADVTIANAKDKTPFALAEENTDFQNSEAYWALNDATLNNAKLNDASDAPTETN